MEAGLHLVVSSHPASVRPWLIAEAAAARSHVADLDSFRHQPDPHRPALVVGFGALPHELRQAIERLASCPELNGNGRRP